MNLTNSRQRGLNLRQQGKKNEELANDLNQGIDRAIDP